MMAGRGVDLTAAGGPARHIPVMLSEVIEALEPRDGKHFIDGTFGAGGYSRGLLELRAAACLPSTAIRRCTLRRQSRIWDFPGRLKFVLGRYAEMRQIAEREGIAAVDGVALDLGVSSMQLDEAERGFSFARTARSTCAWAPRARPPATSSTSCRERELAAIICHARRGEARPRRSPAPSSHAARKSRSRAPRELADIVARVLGRRHDDPKHPATRTFQALRLYLNEELAELARGLGAAERAPQAERAARRRHLPFARRPHRQALFRRAQHARPKGLPPFAGEGRIKFFTKLPTS